MIAKKFVQTIVPTILHYSAKLSGPLLISDISSVYFFCAIALVLDRVFRSDSTTREVYEAGAKEVALSVVSGINCEYKHFFFMSFSCFLNFTWTSLINTQQNIFQQVFLLMDKQAVERHSL